MPLLKELNATTRHDGAKTRGRTCDRDHPTPKAVLDEMGSAVRGSKVTEVTLPLSRNLFAVFG